MAVKDDKSKEWISWHALFLCAIGLSVFGAICVAFCCLSVVIYIIMTKCEKY